MSKREHIVIKQTCPLEPFPYLIYGGKIEIGLLETLIPNFQIVVKCSFMTCKQIDLHKGSHQSKSGSTLPSYHDRSPSACYTFFIFRQEISFHLCLHNTSRYDNNTPERKITTFQNSSDRPIKHPRKTRTPVLEAIPTSWAKKSRIASTRKRAYKK